MYNIKKIVYGSYLSLDSDCTHGDQKSESAKICYRLKKKMNEPKTKMTTIDYYIDQMRTNYESLKFKEFFDSDTCLVPIPGRSVHSNEPSVAKNIADAMIKYGFCKKIINCIKRKSYLKSSFPNLKDRPTIVQQCRSLDVEYFDHDGKILLVDDVVTTGTTGIAVANLLHNHTKNKNICLFTVMRTLYSEHFEKIIDPKKSSITIGSDGKGLRDPTLFNF